MHRGNADMAGHVAGTARCRVASAREITGKITGFHY